MRGNAARRLRAVRAVAGSENRPRSLCFAYAAHEARSATMTKITGSSTAEIDAAMSGRWSRTF